MPVTYGWLRLAAGVPEFGRYVDTRADLELLTDYRFDFGEWTPAQFDEFVAWLRALPLGVIVPYPGCPGVRLVRVSFDGAAAPA